MKLFQLLFLFLFAWLGLAANAQEPQSDFEKLSDWMTGEFTNVTNAGKEAKTLKITQIWPDAPTGTWLYAEVAAVDSAGQPQEQWVYFLSEISDGEYSIDYYAIPEAEKYVGAWQDPSMFEGKNAFDLNHQNGCAIFINYDGFQYSGKSNSGTCKIDSDKGNYTSTKISILLEKIQIWENIYNADDKRVSGTGDTPRIYVKK